MWHKWHMTDMKCVNKYIQIGTNLKMKELRVLAFGVGVSSGLKINIVTIGTIECNIN